MNKKVLIPLCLALFSIGLSACDLRHAHEFGDEYANDETQHWFKAICEHTDEKGSPENHNYSEWFVSQQKTCEKDEILTRYCDDCGYEETKVGEIAGHTLESVAGQKATCESDGVKEHQHCSTCGRDFDSNGTELSSVTIEKLGHNKLDQWYSDETSHYKVCENDGCTLTFDEAEHTFNEWHSKSESTCQSNKVEQRECSVCGYEDTREIEGKADHNLVDVAGKAKSCSEDGLMAHKQCSVCESLFDTEGNEVTLTDLVIKASHNVSDSYTTTETTHSSVCLDCNETFVAEHNYDSTTGECVCGNELIATLVATHDGTLEWNMEANEKLSANGIFHQNVSNVAKNGDDLADFSLQIQYRGWENNGERTYFYTIASVDGVLTIDNQLGVDPWSHSTFTLSEEHKARLASEEGLDFVVKFDKVNQTMKLYIYTEHELVELHSLNTYFGSMDNFYKLKYALTGEATVDTKVYKTYDTEIGAIFEELNISLDEHSFTNVDAVNPTCTEDGMLAHKHCNICNKNFDNENNELSTVIDPMLGHKQGTTLAYKTTSHWYPCENGVCEEKFELQTHTMAYLSTKTEATETVEGIEIWKCNSCEHTEERNVGTLEHTHTFDTSVWESDGTSHWNPSTCGHEVRGNEASHNKINVAEIGNTCTENGTLAHLVCTTCETKFDNEGTIVEDEDLVIEASHSLKETYVVLDTEHYIECNNCSELFEKNSHSYDATTGECVCGKEIYLTLLGSHSGTDTWTYANEEKVISNAVFHENVSNVAVDANGNLNDFSIGIKYWGWGSAEENYLFTLSSTSDVLIFKIQLGIDPWTHYATNITLSDEHKARLASEEGLDFIVYYNHDTKKLNLYVYTNHEIQLLHEVTMYTKTMNNFYKTNYACSGASVTIKSATYKTYDTDINTIFNKLNLELIDHEYVEVEVSSATCTTDGVVAHKACIMCDLKVDANGNEVEVIPMTGHTYVDGVCSGCDKVSPFTNLSSHTGTFEWNMGDSEKLASNGIIHQNVSNVAKNGEDLADFSLQIQYRGWENNGERTYFYTIKSADGVLTIDNQLGVSPWSFTTFTLTEEHKARLASAEGLDFYVQYDHTNQKLRLYIVTDNKVELLHTLNTYYNGMTNFYKFKYTLTGEATVNTYTYTISENFDADSDLKNL